MILALGWLVLFPGGLWGHPVLGHAHNDYEHDRPLVDALEHGFEVVEADVHLIDGDLQVSHLRPWVPKRSRTLRKLYLEPLMERFRERGRIGEEDRPFFLMIDFKTDAEPTWAVLCEQLEVFRPMLTEFGRGEVLRQGVVTVFISGNRPVGALSRAETRLAALDGRPGELGRGWGPSLAPFVSAHYKSYFRWRGRGDPPADELEGFRRLCQAAEAEGKRVRLWGSPESEKVWRVLIEAGADVINTDELERFAAFRTSLADPGKKQGSMNGLPEPETTECLAAY